MRSSPRTLLFLLALPAACGSTEPDASAPGASAAAAPSGSPCGEIIERYRARLKAGSGRCEADADCMRYGGVDPEDVCGGVTDAATGRALSRLSAELDTAGCPRLPYSCPALEPRCMDGTCRSHADQPAPR